MLKAQRNHSLRVGNSTIFFISAPLPRINIVMTLRVIAVAFVDWLARIAGHAIELLVDWK
jgi:hypothetical protein